MEVADRIVVMNKGVIEQIGSPGEVYENPASDFVYHFLGDSNRLQLGNDQHLLFRPHEVSLSRSAVAEHRAAEVRDIRPLGAITRVTLKVDGQDELIEAEVVKDHDSLAGLARGETLYFKPKAFSRWPISDPAAGSARRALRQAAQSRAALRRHLQRPRAVLRPQPALAQTGLQQRRPQRAAEVRLAFAPVGAGAGELPTAAADLRQVDSQPGQPGLAGRAQAQRPALLLDPAGIQHPCEHTDREFAGQVVVAGPRLAQRRRRAVARRQAAPLRLQGQEALTSASTACPTSGPARR